MTHYDVIVLGIGGFGSAACYHAARRGASVLGLDQFAPAHDLGSSHGETRIIRQAYFEHADYVPLLIRAYDLWRDLEQETGQTLFQKVGLMISGPPESDSVAGTKHAAQLHNLPLETLTPEEATQRFRGFHIPHDHEVLFEANAGYLKVEDCTLAHIALAQKHGADLRFQTPVISWQSDGRTVTVRTEREEFSAKSLILTAGAWSSRCLDGLSPPLTVVRKFVGWFPVKQNYLHALEHGPTFFYETGLHQFYGFPAMDGATLKIAEHTGGDPISDPTLVDRTYQDHDELSMATLLRQWIPAVDPKPERYSICLYTRTPDSHFIVDKHPRFSNVVVGCGFSGHGYKFTPVLGDVLAELSLHGKTDAAIDFLSINRRALRR